MPYGLLAQSRSSREPHVVQDDTEDEDYTRNAWVRVRPLSEGSRLSLVGLLLFVGMIGFALLGGSSVEMPQMQPRAVTGSFEKSVNKSKPMKLECEHCSPCRDRRECLSIVDDFFETAPKGRLGLYRTYAGALSEGDCELCDVSPDFNSLKQRCDIYDNAVAALYLIKRQRFAEAQSILDVFLRLLYPLDFRNIYPEELYKGVPSGHILTLLAASYECDTEVKAGTYDRPQVFDGGVDSGNNAWVAMAFAHFAAATGKGCYRMPAEDILHAISMSGTCEDHLDGFLARLPPWRGSQRSVEHNIDLYALASMPGKPNLRRRAANFVQGMYGKNKEFPEAYNVGTVGGARCDTTSTQGDGVPADGQFWNVLADLDNQAERVGKSISWVIFADTLWDHDVDELSGQKPAPALHGTRFTSKGYGVQWEETAGAVMALAHFLHYRAAGSEEKFKQQLKLRLNASRVSLRTLLSTYKAVPASVRGGNGKAYDLHNGYAEFPGGTDTGMGFSYLRMVHIASTAWTGLALLYQTNEDDDIVGSANPFKLSPSQLPEANSYCLPGQSMPRSSVTDRGCEIARWS